MKIMRKTNLKQELWAQELLKNKELLLIPLLISPLLFISMSSAFVSSSFPFLLVKKKEKEIKKMKSFESFRKAIFDKNSKYKN